MKRILSISLVATVLLSLLVFPLYLLDSSVSLVVVERYDRGAIAAKMDTQNDDSMNNGHYVLLPFKWSVTAKYLVNTKNKYGFSATAVVVAIQSSANEWDGKTSFAVFEYCGITSKTAGRRDGYNVISWGSYRSGVIAVTYIWYVGSSILETDMILNTRYKWSLSGEAGKMDVQNIVTHEFGHWCGLDDLYDSSDYWLTMYGYSSYGEIYKQTLGLGDILGLQTVYGA